MLSHKSQFLIAAVSSNCGKTTITLGLLRALRKRGLKVQPFKCGGDYIDPKFHQISSGSPSVNLDLFLSSECHVQGIFRKYSQDSDIAIVEGVMGMYDGYARFHGSSAEIAGVLGLPVVLIIQPEAMGYSVAAIVKGYRETPPYPNVVGVIFNQINSESHYRIVSEAAEEMGVRSLGYLPTDKRIEMPSRYLGLSLEHQEKIEEMADLVAVAVEEHIDIDRLLDLTKGERSQHPAWIIGKERQELSTAIAFDEAFSFVYQQHFDYLQRQGRCHFFSPLRDGELPSADLLYLPGGYPELYLPQLSQNQSLMKGIRKHIENGGKVLAEGGGMLYLSDEIIGSNGVRYPMVGVLKQSATMQGSRLTLGYRQWCHNGRSWRGQEYHISQIEAPLPSVAQQYNALGIPVEGTFIQVGNIIASYSHLYWAEKGDLLSLF